MKYSKQLIAAAAMLALGGCFTVPAGPSAPRSDSGRTGAMGYAGAPAEPSDNLYYGNPNNTVRYTNPDRTVYYQEHGRTVVFENAATGYTLEESKSTGGSQ